MPSPAEPMPPVPPSVRAGDLAAALALAFVVAVIVSLVTGAWRTPAHAAGPGAAELVRASAVVAPPPAPTPAPAPAPVRAIVFFAPGRPPAARRAPRRATARISRSAPEPALRVSDSSVAGFLPLYETAAKAFGINWLLLASVHRQETAFSTAAGTYAGLNSAGCCGGPMQFNVTNGPVSTWARMSDAYLRAPRPADYPHQTQDHPSIYDDFDAIMAAARLLAANGASAGLDAGAWRAAYGYYGHDAAGVRYADRVLAQAVSWSQNGFCAACAVEAQLVSTVHSSYGPGGSGSAPVAATGPAPRRPSGRRPSGRRPSHRHSTSSHRQPRHGHHHGHARGPAAQHSTGGTAASRQGATSGR